MHCSILYKIIMYHASAARVRFEENRSSGGCAGPGVCHTRCILEYIIILCINICIYYNRSAGIFLSSNLYKSYRSLSSPPSQFRHNLTLPVIIIRIIISKIPSIAAGRWLILIVVILCINYEYNERKYNGSLMYTISKFCTRE